MKNLVRYCSAILIAFLFFSHTIVFASNDIVPLEPSLSVAYRDGVVEDLIFTFRNPLNRLQEKEDTQFQILYRVDGSDPSLYYSGNLNDTLQEDGNSRVSTFTINPALIKNIDIINHNYEFHIRYNKGGVTFPNSSAMKIGNHLPYQASNWSLDEIKDAKRNHLIPVSLHHDLRKEITREEFTEILVKVYERLQGVHVAVNTPVFSDTENPAISIASQLGLVQGTGNGYFEPHRLITREEMATIITRMLSILSDYENNLSISKPFKDDEKISHWARDSVYDLQGSQIMSGDENQNFLPLQNASREQGIVIGQRIYSLLK